MSKVVTRFPPSPTGYFHIGSARTALFNYLFALHHGGTMYLRFEDTDKERSKKEFETDILEGLKWLGISYTTPDVYRQSEKTEIYRAHLKRLLDSGAAYEAEAGTINPDKRVIRFKNPNVQVTFHDLIRGEISFDTAELKDFVVAKSIDEPLYHLAVVVDDHDMGVTHVIRGEDHISNTPRQILILEALGFARPHYAHIPLILAPDKSKMSKRHGAVSMTDYRAMGFLHGAIINYLALLGWNPGDDRELYDLDALAQQFSLEHVQKSGAIFDIEKLKWFNREYLKALSAEDFYTYCLPALQQALERRSISFDPSVAMALVPLLRNSFSTVAELKEKMLAGEYDFFFADPTLDTANIPDKKSTLQEAAEHLRYIAEKLPEVDPFSETGIKDAFWNYASEKGRGAVLWPFRYALSGRTKSPDPFTIAAIIGRGAAVRRLLSALAKLKT